MVRLAQRTKKSTVDGVSHGAPTAALHDEVAEALERLSQLLVSHTSRDVMAVEPGPEEPTLAAAQEAVRFLGQVAAAWADVPDGALPATGAGFGSAVVVEDLDEGVRETFTLMTGAFLDIDGGQVSLASPIGQALLGAEAGDIVSVQTPHRLRRLRVIDVRT
ncbi:MAG: GreA/GreB family elongation factor, partial [Longimicrobiales bacterium]